MNISLTWVAVFSGRRGCCFYGRNFIMKKGSDICLNLLMDGEGFEPSKALLTDLQSAPFGHSGIHPSMEPIGLEPMTLCL